MRKTRKQRALWLLELVEKGPASLELDGKVEPKQYKLWVESWIIPELKRLIPELKEKK